MPYVVQATEGFLAPFLNTFVSAGKKEDKPDKVYVRSRTCLPPFCSSCLRSSERDRERKSWAVVYRSEKFFPFSFFGVSFLFCHPSTLF